MLADDLGEGDLTTGAVIPCEMKIDAEIVSREAGIIAGIEEAQVLLEGEGLTTKIFCTDGDRIKPRQVLMKITGNARTILSVERTLLNLLCRMSGIATATKRLIDKLERAKLKTLVACTRKTAPGLLYFDKKAVETGGGDTHRLHLDDMILIKDNHITVAGSIPQALNEAKKHASFSKKIEVEVTNTSQALQAAEGGANIIMLDNLSPKQIESIKKALAKAGFEKVKLEASGGITEDTIAKFAATGVDIVSLGSLTHSARVLDLTLNVKKSED